MRAGSLQELVYKQGQAGVTKASVTVTFNNQDKKASPVGYEHVDKISVCRQVFIHLIVYVLLRCLSVPPLDPSVDPFIHPTLTPSISIDVHCAPSAGGGGREEQVPDQRRGGAGLPGAEPLPLRAA